MAAEVPCAPGAVIPPSAPAESGCSDEFALDCTFAACDPERTGMVQPQQVVEYVAAMTGHSGHDGRLQALRRALDPAAAGTALDWTRFRMAMGAWIAACRQDGAEEQDMATGDTGPVPVEDDGHASPAAAELQGDNTDITTHSAEAAGLRSRARQLAAQNAKLQRDAELAEELNARLAEEIAQLQTQLRSSRQALEQARVAVDELDDMKAVVKRLEEENTELRRQARHTEKEQRSLCSQAECLQEENQRLLAEGQGLREQIQAQVARMDSLEAQLCRGTALLSARDAALAQAGQRAQELTASLEEYERMVQELRLETTRLRQQLGQLRDAWAMRPWCPRGQLDIQATAATASPGTGDKEEEEEEDTGTVVSGGGGLVWSSEEVAKAVAPQAPLSPWTPLSPWALVLLALLALLYLLPCQWPQLQLHYRSPPPL
ncbi:protein KASH5 [Vidua macroura]|uniref:protein KASH5 n=1 Tax=Vidua chalybeata TaxID=81927 RepID=UPI0023A8350F|nr:protein KASH5 [Vidua chalybeata]XP_053825246.1 protein KASH5 [Vidua macroura]